MIRRDRLLLGIYVTALNGVLLLFAALGWFVWHESVIAEERRLGLLAQGLGESVEQAIIDARDMLDALNGIEAEPCSDTHMAAMQQAVIARPYTRAIGYWQAAERLCGMGLIRGAELMPSRADRIYPSGVIAWWPGAETEVGGVQLFLMRYGAHDVAIDPRLLLDTGIAEERSAGLWVEGLRLAAHPGDAELPSPERLKPGLTVDQANNRVISRFTLGTIFPIDIVAMEPIASFRDRYLPKMATAASLALLLITSWIYVVYRYSRRRLSLGAELREAIPANRLLVYYQPIIELAGGRCVGAEALVRWKREGGNLIGPEIFIPVAEEAGLLPEITRSVLRNVVADLGELLREDHELHINVNLSRQDLECAALPQMLGEELSVGDVSPSSINLEITERALVDSDDARRLIRELRRRGHRVAIDDFGTGYSSLSYLESFEIDTLKIDKSFVDSIETEAFHGNVISHVIEMAHSLRLNTVAEGIEYAHQAQWLREHGVVHGQGFLYSRPLSARYFIHYYRHEARAAA
ncbi:MAG: EAL domain-containing protein [Woeseiaceae bacterium]